MAEEWMLRGCIVALWTRNFSSRSKRYQALVGCKVPSFLTGEAQIHPQFCRNMSDFLVYEEPSNSSQGAQSYLRHSHLDPPLSVEKTCSNFTLSAHSYQNHKQLFAFKDSYKISKFNLPLIMFIRFCRWLKIIKMIIVQNISRPKF